jgi:hypothetical protein
MCYDARAAKDTKFLAPALFPESDTTLAYSLTYRRSAAVEAFFHNTQSNTYEGYIQLVTLVYGIISNRYSLLFLCVGFTIESLGFTMISFGFEHALQLINSYLCFTDAIISASEIE